MVLSNKKSKHNLFAHETIAYWAIYSLMFCLENTCRFTIGTTSITFNNKAKQQRLHVQRIRSYNFIMSSLASFLITKIHNLMESYLRTMLNIALYVSVKSFKACHNKFLI